jgi:diaminopimelate epimerase
MSIPENNISVPFVKMSAAGNDFVLIDETQLSVSINDYERFARVICNRHLGVGADGLLVYKSHPGLPFTMDYYNADGSTGAMCGNGGRCVAAYYFDVYGNRAKSVKFMAFGHIYTAVTEDDLISVEMKDPTHIITDLTINVSGDSIRCYYIDTGSPHVVVFWEDYKRLYPDMQFDTFDIRHIGSLIRRHEAFRPLGANVNFVKPVSDGKIQLRTYERGVEDETLGCGTGSIASAIMISLRAGYQPPIRVQSRSGEVLIVRFIADKSNTTIKDVTLTGSWAYHHSGYFFSNEAFTVFGIKQISYDFVKRLYSSTMLKENRWKHIPSS